MLDSHRSPLPDDKPDCPQCAAGRADPWHALYDMTCLGCVARHLAHSPDAWEAVRLRKGEALTAWIRAVWGVRYEQGRQAVWGWMRCLRDHPARTA